MKKLSLITLLLLFPWVNAMYHGGRNLENTEVTLINKSPIPITIQWEEIVRSRREKINHTLEPGERKIVEVGAKGNVHVPSAKVIYKPIKTDDEFTQEFNFDLPKSGSYAFNAVTLGQLLNTIWVPVIFKADEEGDFKSAQHLNLQHPSQWEAVLKRIGTIKKIEEL